MCAGDGAPRPNLVTTHACTRVHGTCLARPLAEPVVCSDEQPVIGRGGPCMALAPRQRSASTFPLIIAQGVASVSSVVAGPMESKNAPEPPKRRQALVPQWDPGGFVVRRCQLAQEVG